MMTLARKPSEASFPQATQATVGRFKARLRARRDWAASTPRQDCRHVETGLQARRDWAANTPKLGCKHAQWGKGVFRTPKRSTLHKPAQHAPSANAARCIAHRTALRSPTGCGAAGRPSPLPFPHNRKRGGRQVMRKWRQAVARPRKKFYLCPYRTLQTEKDR